MIFCNAEGIQWVDHYRVVVSSDKAKAKQPYWCARRRGRAGLRSRRSRGAAAAWLPAPSESLLLPFLSCRRCDAKDQSIHLFAMPLAFDPWAPAGESGARLAAEAAADAAEADARGEL